MSKDWQLIWHWKGPHRIRVFLWFLMHGKIKTKDELFRRHIHNYSICDICGYDTENILHALRDCISAKRIWSSLSPINIKADFLSNNLRGWLLNNLAGGKRFEMIENWSLIFGVTVWKIWYWRNQLLFANVSPCRLYVVSEIKAWVHEIQQTFKATLPERQCKVLVGIGWTALTWPLFRLNTDGSRGVNGAASAGGLIPDANGNWVRGFGMNIGFCSISMAELWGLYQGLYLAWHHGIRFLGVEVGSRCIIHMLESRDQSPNMHTPLINSIKNLLKRDWHISIRHIYREANFAADFLAKKAGSLALGFHAFQEPPAGLGPWLCYDMYESMIFRSVVP